MREIGGMIAFLVVAQHAQCSGCIKDRFGQDAGEQQSNLIHRQRRRFLFELDPQAHQEMMSR